MNGAGTAENPYIIMTAEDLYSMEEIGGSETYFSLGSDIDFNNTPYAENFQPISLNCKMLSGNGHTIRNINYSTPNDNACMFVLLCESTAVENLNIENIRLSGKNIFIFTKSITKCSISLQHCVFVLNDMIILSQANASSTNRYCLIHEYNVKMTADYCTFAVKMRSEKTYPLFSNDNLLHIQTKAEVHINSSVNSGNVYSAFVSESVVSDSYFFLKLDAPENDNVSSFDFSANNNSFNSSYLVCEPCAVFSVIQWNGNVKSTCFYDDTLMRKNNADIQVKSTASMVNTHALTTEQCKNPEYLRSIGFNCAGAEE